MLLSRAAQVISPLGEGALLLFGMKAREALGRPFVYELDLLAPDERVDFSELLGQTMSVVFEVGEFELREFHGHVTQFSLAGELGRFVRYRAVLRPWFSLLSQNSNCRIFQNLTVPDVIKQVFRDQGFTDFEEALSSEYRSWEYLVQYRESDFHFVSRLMEQEGIYYFFKHENGKHTMVLADAYSAHGPIGSGSLPYFPPQHGERRDQDHINSWRVARQVRPGVYVASDFDYERPRAKLMSQLRMPGDHARSEYEIFDYPGEFATAAEGDTQVRLRLEEHQADHEVVRGGGNARKLYAGGLFTLTDFVRDDQNKEYLVIESSYEIRVDDYESLGSGGSGGSTYECQFTAIDSKRPYRTRRTTRKPTVEGPQTAVVVGQANQEIWTDEYGRVKIQFHWDRYGKSDENSSCWVRVAQIWAGSGFGGIHVPRIGQEVIVDFLEGDPDRPIITGRVYNGDNMPPYELPANQTQSGIKSRSTKGGGADNCNEIRFEDKKGSEELFIQAEKTQTTKVKGSQSISVAGSRSISVGGDESTSVSGTRSATITKKETQTFKDAREMTVALTNSDTITGKHTGTYDGGREVTVKQFDNTTVNGANKVTTVHGQYNITADTQFQVTQAADSVLVKDSITATSAGPIKLTNGGCTVELKDGKLSISADTEITLSCGGASITLKKDGTIEVTGAQKVALSGGPSSIELAAPGATMSGPKATVSGAAMTEVTGAMVKIN